jgi:hypothetical protein
VRNLNPVDLMNKKYLVIEKPKESLAVLANRAWQGRRIISRIWHSFQPTQKKTSPAKAGKSARVSKTPKDKASQLMMGRLSTVLKAPHFSEKALISPAAAYTSSR